MQFKFGVVALGLSVFTQGALGSPASIPEVTGAPVAGKAAADPSGGEPVITSSGGTAFGGALHPTPLVGTLVSQAIQPPPPLLTISIINQYGADVSTTHNRNADSPAATGANFDPGVIRNGATATFAAPTNWAGRVGIAAARDGDLTDARDVSLIEANFIRDAGSGLAVADVDVSYVDAFTVPITCSCSGRTVTGCNKNLLAISSCPAGYLHKNSCYNPLKADNFATAATPFFAPCAHAGYTYPRDSLANSWGECQSGHITCCIGTSCPPGPRQS
ncbi:hypothetical protein F5Y17DRAFT_457138 [Xylariaceae sp. FL0594]|nr:hypothetical protein F5Y17DRAFT_457138 [Xylariaceae sp. FL0594]